MEQARCIQRFLVRNPTSFPSKFKWSPAGRVDGESPFSCLTPSGTILAGGCVEMMFQCTPLTASSQVRHSSSGALKQHVHFALEDRSDRAHWKTALAGNVLHAVCSSISGSSSVYSWHLLDEAQKPNHFYLFTPRVYLVRGDAVA